MLRRRFLIAPCLTLALLLGGAARRSLLAESPQLPAPRGNDNTTAAPALVDDPSYIEPDSNMTAAPFNGPNETHSFLQAPNDFDSGPPDCSAGMPESDSYFSKLHWLGLRHSSTHGRNAGMGIPLTGTSWLNRPYYLGGHLGTVWLTRPIAPDLTTDVDMFGGIFAGWDWDHYWGTEIAINRATPEIFNRNARDADRGDRLMQETISMMYYPWGDSQFRPYWRLGIGAMHIDWPTDDGMRRDETLWSVPIGIGLKYPFRRYLVGRAEFADQIGVGNSGVATQHDLTLTLGLEWRFGVHPRSYWPWNPSRHIW